MSSADALPDPAAQSVALPATTESPRTALSAFSLRGGAFTLLVLRLSDPKDPSMFQFLADKVAQAPNFFRHAPLVLDLQDLANAPPFNIAELGRRLRQHQLVPVGVQNGTDDQHKAAVNAGLCLFPAGRKAPLAVPAEAQPSAAPVAPPAPTVTKAPPAPPPSPPKASTPVEPPAAVPRPVETPVLKPVEAAAGAETALGGKAALLVTQPVRSGQRVYAQGGDLAVVTSISPGAELLADGHIHVYGALRGRALAGVSGNPDARIFCRSLEAELISIAGYWRVRDDLPEALIGKPVQIALDGERLIIEPLP